jgi:MscS family membrane protein
MKFILIFFSLLLSLSLHADSKYSIFLNQQIDIVTKMNGNNVTQEQIQDLLKEQNQMYEGALNLIMSEKKKYIENTNLFESEIFALNKIISINKRARNNYAVLRDQVQIKSYLVARAQAILVRDVLIALDEPTLEEFDRKLNDYVVLNRQKIEELYTHSYDDVLEMDSDSKTLREAKAAIEEFDILKDVSSDIISYLYKYENKMYRLNKYYKFHLISFAIFINSSDFGIVANSILEEYNLSIVKLIFIAVLILVISFLRKIVYVTLEKYVLSIDYLKKYSENILVVIRKPIEFVIIIININMIVYVYNDFSNSDVISRLFNILYGVFFTYVIYRIINTMASITLCSVSSDKVKMKNDLINVGLKVLNFIVLLVGLLVILYYAGVDLTTVLSGLGIGGFAVAFAAKDTISNFFGTISILVSDVFSQGDWIEINNHEGVIVEIGLRVTTIRTFDNALIAIPNGTFAGADVKNWSKRTLGRRIKMNVGVKYDSKPKDIQKALHEIKEMLEHHPGIATKDTIHEHRNEKMAKLVSKDDLEGVKKTLLVNLDEFAGSSINIMIYCFSKSVDWADWLDTKEDVMFQIMGILEKNSLEFAFPSLSIYKEN